jgi:heme exporter protein D
VNFQFESFQAFMAMAGHGPYVWASYGLTVLILLSLVIAPLASGKTVLKTVARQQRRHQPDKKETR